MSVPFELVLNLEPSRYQRESHYMAVESLLMGQNRCWWYVRLLKIFHLWSATEKKFNVSSIMHVGTIAKKIRYLDSDRGTFQNCTIVCDVFEWKRKNTRKHVEISFFDFWRLFRNLPKTFLNGVSASKHQFHEISTSRRFSYKSISIIKIRWLHRCWRQNFETDWHSLGDRVLYIQLIGMLLETISCSKFYHQL